MAKDKNGRELPKGIMQRSDGRYMGHFKYKVIHIRGTLKYRRGAGYFKDSPKTVSSEREIPMLDEVCFTLKKQKREQEELRLVAGREWRPMEGLGDLVFTSAYHRRGYGVPISNDALNVDVKKIVGRIREEYLDFPHVNPHMLRHCFATRALERGIPPKVVQEFLGHTSITMTLDLYSHVLQETNSNTEIPCREEKTKVSQK